MSTPHKCPVCDGTGIVLEHNMGKDAPKLPRPRARTARGGRWERRADMMTLHDIAEIEARANAATPGPWKSRREVADWKFPHVDVVETPTHRPQVDGFGIKLHYGGRCSCVSDATNDKLNRQSSTDADFIAAARTDVPALCYTAWWAIELLRDAIGSYRVCKCSKAYTSSRMVDPLCGYHANEEAIKFLAEVTKEPPK